jgi:hypothetical protein
MSASSLSFRLAVLFALIGIILGLYMAASHTHTLGQAHAHINLIGWVSLFLGGSLAANSRLMTLILSPSASPDTLRAQRLRLRSLQCKVAQPQTAVPARNARAAKLVAAHTE